MKKDKRTERFPMMMSKQCKRALTRMALAEDCSRAEWIHKAIQRSAMRKGLWE
jgi:predicted HicB family RNase H-like nuclease